MKIRSKSGTLVQRRYPRQYANSTLVKKYRYPRHRQNINTKHPRHFFFLGAIGQRWNVPRSRDLHWMFLMPPCIFPDKTFHVYVSTDWMRVLFLHESTSASVAILTRDPASTLVRFATVAFTGGNRTMAAAATIVSMAAAKKAQQNVFALYHSYNRTILLEFIWILDFHFKIVLVLRRRYLIPIRCNNGKRKMWPWRWLHHFDFQHWRWLHALMTMVALFRAGNFWQAHSRSPADEYVFRLYDCCQVWYV